MIPIRLWSVVVSQPTSPRRSLQIRSRRSTYCWPRGRTTVAISDPSRDQQDRDCWAGAPLLQLLQIGDDLVHLSPGESKIGHPVAGLYVLRVMDAIRKPLRGLWDRARGERGAALQRR